jgi:hypothetical protein
MVSIPRRSTIPAELRPRLQAGEDAGFRCWPPGGGRRTTSGDRHPGGGADRSRVRAMEDKALVARLARDRFRSRSARCRSPAPRRQDLGRPPPSTCSTRACS